MADKPLPHSPTSPQGPQSAESRPATGESAALVVSTRPSAQRGGDVRDAMAEMTERAQMISQEAGTKITAAMKEVIGAAAGIAGFAVESARDLVQYMVRRGQMTPDEAEKLIREAEEAHGKRSRTAKPAPERNHKPEPAREAARREPAKGSSASASVTKAEKPAKPEKTEKKAPAKKSAGKKASTKSAPAKKRR